MTWHEFLLPQGDWSWFALNTVWQTIVIGLIGLLFLRLMNRPVEKAWCALLALGVSVVTPAASLMVDEWHLALPDAGHAPIRQVASSPPGPIDLTNTNQARFEILADTDILAGNSAALAGTPRGAILIPTNIWPYFLAFWGVASAIVAVQILTSYGAKHRLIRESVECTDGEMLARVEHVATRMGNVRVPRVYVSSKVDSPTVDMVIWPTLILPDVMIQKLDANAWDAVLSHELAHIRRYDPVTRLIALFVVMLVPWQPLIWLLRREHALNCEKACDDWTVSQGHDPVEFASLLTEWQTFTASLVSVAMARGSNVRSRVLRLLEMRDVPAPAMNQRNRMVMIPAMLAISAAVCFAQVRGELNGSEQASSSSSVSANGNAASASKNVGQSTLKYYAQRGELHVETGNVPELRSIQIDARQAITGSKTTSRTTGAGQPTPNHIVSGAYTVKPSDVLLIQLIKQVPKGELKLEPFDILQVVARGTLPDAPIAGTFQLDNQSKIVLGPGYGRVSLAGLTVEEADDKILKHLKTTLDSPEVAVSILQRSQEQMIAGEHKISPDGTVTLGIYGQVAVSDKTVPEVRKAIEKHLAQYFEDPKVSVGVTAYNSRAYYVIVDESEAGDSLLRVSLVGRQTVLDALAQIKGLRIYRDSKIWLTRGDKKMAVDWQAITRQGNSATNFVLRAGDRLFVSNSRRATQPSY